MIMKTKVLFVENVIPIKLLEKDLSEASSANCSKDKYADFEKNYDKSMGDQYQSSTSLGQDLVHSIAPNQKKELTLYEKIRLPAKTKNPPLFRFIKLLRFLLTILYQG